MIQFSIVTVTKDAEKDLRRTCKSLERIESHKFEWIVIDGNSKDGTLEYLRNNKLVSKYVSEKDEGIADAWNKGIALASGSHVLVLNAGDEYYPDIFAVLSPLLDAEKIVLASAAIMNSKGRQLGVFKSQPNRLRYGMHVAHNMCIIPKIVYDQVGKYKNLKYSMDYEWFYRYKKMFGIGGFIKCKSILGNMYNDGVSSKKWLESFRQNRYIAVSNGECLFFAWIVFGQYVFKHYLIMKLRSMQL